MKLSVFVVTHGRCRLLQRAVASVLRSLPPESELLILLNGPDPETRFWLDQQTDPRVKIFFIEREGRSTARNRAFLLAQGEILYFLDDDVVVPRALFHFALEQFEENPAIDYLGGPNLTPPESPFLEQCFGAVMTSAFAAPLIRARYGALDNVRRAATGNEHNLILCNLALRRSSFLQSPRFAPGLKSNEENLFLHRCRERGLRGLYLSELYVYHRRRSSLRGFLQQIYSYGFGRAQQTWRAPQSLHPLFLIPAAACALVLTAPLSSSTTGLVLALSAGHLGVSALAALFSGPVRRLGWPGIGLVALLTGALHLAYGVGLWAGFFRGLRSRATSGEWIGEQSYATK